MDNLISVIVPVYNTAPYIDKCVDSVLRQTYPYFEVLLIDDGSRDNSLEICEKLCALDSRLRLLRQEHQGVSAARNLGLDKAKGKYLFFLDSDDAIHPELLGTLIKLAEETDAFILETGSHIMESKELDQCLYCKKDNKSPPYCRENTRECLNRLLYGDPVLGHFVSIGGKMIRKTTAFPYRFDEKLTNGEDTKFLYQLLLDGADVVTLQKEWYYYRVHEKNASRQESIAVYKSLYEYMKYIREQEYSCGRTSSAVYQEKSIIDRILKWYQVSRNAYDKERQQFLRNLATIERKSEQFRWLSLRYRIKFYLGFYCYPLYISSHLFWMNLKLWMEKRKHEHS